MAHDCANNYLFLHKFIDPAVCTEMLINAEAKARGDISEYIDGMQEHVEAVFNGVKNAKTWVFMPYNIGYDFQTLL